MFRFTDEDVYKRQAVPYIIAYMSSNVVFLMIGLKPLGEKLNRVQTKHGIF